MGSSAAVDLEGLEAAWEVEQAEGVVPLEAECLVAEMAEKVEAVALKCRSRPC